MNKDPLTEIEEKRTRLAVIGLGHVGLPMASVFASEGYSVTGVDIRRDVVNAISSLKFDTHEPGLDEMIEKTVKAGKMKTSVDTIASTKQADIVLVCVQTPVTKSGKPDLTYLKNAIRNVAKGLSRGSLVVVVSTVPAGTMKNVVREILEQESGLKCSRDFWLAYSPERILPGNAIREFVENDRLVGGFDSRSAELAAELFRTVTKGNILLTDLLSAELAKLAENTFRDVNIAFANELALICERVGADVLEVIRLANTHPRVTIHKPGCGVGGPCLTKDPYLLLHSTEGAKLRSPLIEHSRKVNDQMATHLVDLVVEALKQAGKKVKDSRITVLGAAYKAEVGDTTNSPSERITHGLLSTGADVTIYDPYTSENFGAKTARDIRNALAGADCIVIATDHNAFRKLDLENAKGLMHKRPIVVDGKRVITPRDARVHGFTYYGVGMGVQWT
jgi:UDP-N-acetyl-D-mannosaminuronic acid dehydrogenase